MSMATRPASTLSSHDHRVLLMDELLERYGSGGFSRRWRFWRKKYAWVVIVGGAKVVKRAIDLVASLCGLLVLSPLFAVVAVLVKLTDGGPVLYWQTRVGQWGREFPFPKFRSMYVNAPPPPVQQAVEADPALAQAGTAAPTAPRLVKVTGRDPRVTWIGRYIRKLSIDELPQLWCVLKGDMSLVGPRPPVPKEVALYTLSDRRRLDAIPGLTCIWQVSGRSDIPFDKQVELDKTYIESQSVWLDLKILLKTVPAVLLGKGAY